MYQIPVLLAPHEDLSGLEIQGVLRNLGHPHYQEAQDDLITTEKKDSIQYSWSHHGDCKDME